MRLEVHDDTRAILASRLDGILGGNRYPVKIREPTPSPDSRLFPETVTGERQIGPFERAFPRLWGDFVLGSVQVLPGPGSLLYVLRADFRAIRIYEPGLGLIGERRIELDTTVNAKPGRFGNTAIDGFISSGRSLVPLDAGT